ncbi:MAG: ligase-associated DNA damage response exonuclease [Pirellulales bacterium]
MQDSQSTLLTETANGLYCAQGDFYVDPWRPVKRAVVTHAHSDHAVSGSEAYLAAREGDAILRMRLGSASSITFLKYGEAVTLGGVRLSLHPAGHMTGSAQVRLEFGGRITVVSGDYKLQADPTCRSFEPIRCHTFITESTFGLPIFRWNETASVIHEIEEWQRTNRDAGRASLITAYTVGKAQRILASLRNDFGPIIAHGAIFNACRAYRECGVRLPNLLGVSEVGPGFEWTQALIIAPPSALGSPWMRRFGDLSTAMASGWMRVRGIRRRRAVDRGFVLSDHVDWPDLISAIAMSEAETILVTHGYTDQVVRHLVSQGRQARVVKTQFRGESEEGENVEAPSSDVDTGESEAQG